MSKQATPQNMDTGVVVTNMYDKSNRFRHFPEGAIARGCVRAATTGGARAGCV
jgi:hypothetical protein